MLHGICPQGDANYSSSETPLHPDLNGQNPKQGKDQDVRQQELSAGGDAGDADTWEGCWPASHGTKDAFTTRSWHRAPWCVPQGAEDMSTRNPAQGCLQQLYHPCQHLEATGGPWINKQGSIRTTGYYSALKRNVRPAMKRRAGTLEACHSVKEAGLERRHTV